jgi:hypothetical protein
MGRDLPSGLSSWTGAIQDGVYLPDGLARMRAHPRFEDGIRASIKSALARFDRDPKWREATKSVGRQVIALLALYLDATGGITYTRIEQVCIDLGLMSTGRALAILAQLRLFRYVRIADHQPNKRERHYVPTDDLRHALREQFRHTLIGLSIIEPAAAEVRDRLDEPAVLQALARGFGEGLLAVGRSTEKQPVRRGVFGARNASLKILNALMISGDADDRLPPERPISFSIRGLAQRFGVSRPHVLKLLREAESEGLFRRDGSETTGVFTPELRDQVHDFHARSFIGFALCVDHVLKSMEARDTMRAGAGQQLAAAPG